MCIPGCGDDATGGAAGSSGGTGPSPFHNAGDGGVGDPGTVPVVRRDAGPAPTCGGMPFAASPVRANVLLVIDKSLSMADTPDGFGSDKWSAMHDALETALGAVQDDINLGSDLYPFPDECAVPSGDKVRVPVQTGSTALPKILEDLAAAAPSGGTPTTAALARARRYFTTGAGAALNGERYVLLATDGGPNCNADLSCAASACTVNLDGQCPMAVDNCCDPALAGPGAEAGCLDDQAGVAEIEALAAAGVATFVVGIPGTEAYAGSLAAFAQAGGRPNPNGPPKYYAVSAMGGAAGLADVLGVITQGLITTCRFRLDAAPPDPARLNVEIDGEVVPQPGPDGWELDRTADPPTVVLKGETCARIQREGAQTVEIVYGCPTVIE
jgi:hypothetical protein